MGALVAAGSGVVTFIVSLVGLFEIDGTTWSVWTTGFTPGLFGVATLIPCLAVAAGALALARAYVPGGETRTLAGFTLRQLQIVALGGALLIWLGFVISVLASDGLDRSTSGVELGLGAVLMALGLAGLVAGTVLADLEARRPAPGPWGASAGSWAGGPAAPPPPPPPMAPAPAPGPHTGYHGGPVAAATAAAPAPASAPIAAPPPIAAPIAAPSPAPHVPGPLVPGQATGARPGPIDAEAGPSPWAAPAPGGGDGAWVVPGPPPGAWSDPAADPGPAMPESVAPGAYYDPTATVDAGAAAPSETARTPERPEPEASEPEPSTGGLFDPGTQVISGPPPAPPEQT